MGTKNKLSNLPIALSLIVSISILSSCGAIVDKLIDQMVAETNKQCPMRLDNDTRLDKVTHPEKGTVEYLYTLINLAEEDLIMDKDEATLLTKAAVTENLKNTAVPELKTVLKLKAIFRYTYYDKNGELLFSFDVGPEEYSSL